MLIKIVFFYVVNFGQSKVFDQVGQLVCNKNEFYISSKLLYYSTCIPEDCL